MDKWIKVRVTEEERKQWQDRAEAAGMTLSDLIRDSLANPPKRRRKPQVVVADPALLRQLAALGNNFNQVARVINAADITPDVSARLLVYLTRLNDRLYELRKVDNDAP